MLKDWISSKQLMPPQEIFDIVVKASTDRKASWAIVRDGAVAEFSIADDIPKFAFKNNILKVDTAKAQLKLSLDKDLEAVVAESAYHQSTPWIQNIHLCLPYQEAKMETKNVLSRLGNCDGDSTIWDLGLGYDTFQACIIVNDKDLEHILEDNEGKVLIDSPELFDTIIHYSPARLFRTKFAEILVRQKIPTDGKTVNGPHTHLLPHIIKNRMRFPTPVPEHLCTMIQLDPFGSIIDANGKFQEWLGPKKDPFQLLLEKYGNKEYLELKHRIKEKVLSSLVNGDKQIVDAYADPSMQDVLRVLLAKIVCDNSLAIDIRKSALSTLRTIKAPNLNGLEVWILQVRPELM